jgi:tetratricopeptide (TPR) repeat protein
MNQKSLVVVTVGVIAVTTGFGLLPVLTQRPESPTNMEGQGAAGSTNPIENYKQKRLREALAGLKYEAERVLVDPEVAPRIAQPGTREEAMRWVAEGERLYGLNESIDSIRAFTRAVITNPGTAQAYAGLAKALLSKGEDKKAQACLLTSLSLESDPKVEFELGLNYQRLGDLPEAIRAWERALRLDPKLYDAYARLAVAHYYLENYAQAWRYIHLAERTHADLPPQLRGLISRVAPEPGG